MHFDSVLGVELIEASGIVRSGDHLLLVSDTNPGRYFEYEMSEEERSAHKGRGSAIFKLEQDRIKPRMISGGDLAFDLESIDILNAQEAVVLSERLRSLVGAYRGSKHAYSFVREYDNPVAEFGNVGLEGLAVHKKKDGSALVAVLWEGGYPDYKDIPTPIQKLVGRLTLVRSLTPVIWVHQLPKDARGFKKVKKKNLIGTPIELRVPVPPDSQHEPNAQGFRAPDLVWCAEGENEENWGFIVLLNSRNAPDKGKGDVKYVHQWLQRFNRSGEPVGEPLDLNPFVPDDLKKKRIIGKG